MADDYWLTGKRREANRIIQRQVYRLYIDKLEELHENSLLEHIDLKVLAFTIFGAIKYFFRFYLEGVPLSAVLNGVWLRCTHQNMGGVWVLYFRDPDGIILDAMQGDPLV